MTSLIAALLLQVGSAWAHQGNLTQEPWQACADLPLDAECSFQNTDGDLFRGTCRGDVPPYLCVRSQPILHHHDLHSHGDDHEHSQHASLGGALSLSSVLTVVGMAGALLLGLTLGRRG